MSIGCEVSRSLIVKESGSRLLISRVWLVKNGTEYKERSSSFFDSRRILIYFLIFLATNGTFSSWTIWLSLFLTQNWVISFTAWSFSFEHFKCSPVNTCLKTLSSVSLVISFSNYLVLMRLDMDSKSYQYSLGCGSQSASKWRLPWSDMTLRNASLQKMSAPLIWRRSKNSGLDCSSLSLTSLNIKMSLIEIRMDSYNTG